MNLPENYQNLANAIIMQAVKDYRKSRVYLQKHPATDTLIRTAAWQVECRKKRQAKRGRQGLPHVHEKLSKEEEILDRIMKAEQMLDDVERFFRSDWFCALTDIDGEMLLRKLEEEFE